MEGKQMPIAIFDDEEMMDEMDEEGKITYTEQQVDKLEDEAFEKGMRSAIDIFDSKLPNCEGSAHLLYAIQMIENQILKGKINKLNSEIEELKVTKK